MQPKGLSYVTEQPMFSISVKRTQLISDKSIVDHLATPNLLKPESW